MKRDDLDGDITHINPFNANGISHCHQLEQSISALRDVGWYFSFLFKFS